MLSSKRPNASKQFKFLSCCSHDKTFQAMQPHATLLKSLQLCYRHAAILTSVPTCIFSHAIDTVSIMFTKPSTNTIVNIDLLSLGNARLC